MIRPDFKMLLAAAGFSIGLAGCVPVAYVYPKADYLSASGLPIGESNSDGEPTARAYLLRTTTRGGLVPLSSTEATLSTIPISEEGDVKHFRVTLESGAVLVSALSHGWTTSHDAQIRLYRPGFKTIEIDKQDSNSEIDWIPVKNADEFERAIDRTISVRYAKLKEILKAELSEQVVMVQVHYLGEPETLLRIASEYSRLLRLIRQNQLAVTSESYRDDGLNDVNQRLAEISSLNDLTGHDRLRLKLLGDEIEFERIWSEPLSRLEAKVNWLESKARPSS